MFIVCLSNKCFMHGWALQYPIRNKIQMQNITILIQPVVSHWLWNKGFVSISCYIRWIMQVTAYSHNDENNEWTFRRHNRTSDDPREPVEYVRNGDLVYLEHVAYVGDFPGVEKYGIYLCVWVGVIWLRITWTKSDTDTVQCTSCTAKSIEKKICSFDLITFLLQPFLD